MDTIIDIVAAVFLGADPLSVAGVVNIAIIAAAYFVSGSWLTFYIALGCRGLATASVYSIRMAIHKHSIPRRQMIVAQVRRDQETHDTQEKAASKGTDEEWEKIEGDSTRSSGGSRKSSESAESWDGIIGFLHPFCNAGGGGERVLWDAIRATQQHYPRAICAVYTGDHDSSKSTILERVSKRFDIDLHPPTVVFLYLNTRDYVLASSWSHFTLLGQAIGSLVMAHDALSLLSPDIFIDTMGYAFSTGFCRLFFPEIPTGAYLHYPFIGTHMVESLTSDNGQGVNAGSGRGILGLGKQLYWRVLVELYRLAGRSLDVVMTNSSWTKAHITHLWGPWRCQRSKLPIEVVFPPVAVQEIIDAIPLEGAQAVTRQKKLVYVAQFRPEKNHELVLESFAQMVHSETAGIEGAQLILIGSVRDTDDETLVYKLRLLAKELKVEGQVEFKTKDVSWDEILESLRTSWVGINGMWCEHFGIGVVEYQAAGLIPVVNDSGGPRQDIVIEYDGGPTGTLPQPQSPSASRPPLVLYPPQCRISSTPFANHRARFKGFRASTPTEYAVHFTTALTMPSEAAQAMRRRARSSSKRFTTSTFAAGWTSSLSKLIEMQLRLTANRPPDPAR